MKMKYKLLTKLLVAFVCLVLVGINNLSFVYADNHFSVSPMSQKIVLTPGESYQGSFVVTNPGTNQYDFSYIAQVTPFYVDDKYNIMYENNGDYNQIADWITLKNPEGTISPNQTREIYFSIDVPLTAPAGGQYAAITVTSNVDDNPIQNGLNIQAKYSIAHIIYAEVTGNTVRRGEIISTEVPGFLLSGNISGASLIKNTGNVHGTAKYALKVFPLFSNEEIYTNEETPQELTILPDRELYNRTIWDQTPLVGIFNVVYSAEFEGVTAEVSKMVIKCPIWLLFIVIFVVMALIIWLVMRAKARRRGAE